jgi:hypothetical protein
MEANHFVNDQPTVLQEMLNNVLQRKKNDTRQKSGFTQRKKCHRMLDVWGYEPYLIIT